LKTRDDKSPDASEAVKVNIQLLEGIGEKEIRPP
jgi:hypothetical protein